jgi:hypothetical protein
MTNTQWQKLLIKSAQSELRFVFVLLFWLCVVPGVVGLLFDDPSFIPAALCGFGLIVGVNQIRKARQQIENAGKEEKS